MRPDGKLDVAWNRAHFGAWCIVSSPLILGLDLDSPHLEEVVPFITNSEAIAVNQQWAGSAGFLLSTTERNATARGGIARGLAATAPAGHTPADALGFVRYVGRLAPPIKTARAPPLRVSNETVATAERWCHAAPACTCFTRENGASLDGSAGDFQPTAMYGGEYGRLLCASNGIHVRDSDARWSTWVRASLAPADAEHGAQQVWAKPQPRGAWALFLVNSDDERTMPSAPIDIADLLAFASEGLHVPAQKARGSQYSVRDVWKRAAAPKLAPVRGIFLPPPVPPRDSAFYVLSPVP